MAEPAVETAANTPFGHVLAAWVRATPGARGAVLVDRCGDAVDYARVPERISDLDLQIFGAQLTFATGIFERWSVRRGFGERAVVLVECTGGAVLATAPAPGYFAVGVLGRRAGLGRGLCAWQEAVGALHGLLV